MKQRKRLLQRKEEPSQRERHKFSMEKILGHQWVQSTDQQLLYIKLELFLHEILDYCCKSAR